MTTQDKPAVGPLSAETPVSKTHPMMQAWTQYSGGPEYENSARWAIQPEHTKGSMWAAFCAGWSAGTRLAPAAPVEAGGSEPVEVTIFCPKCATPHVDEGEWATTRHHKTHQCQSCGHEWRPFPFATVGVPHPALRPQPSGETLQSLAQAFEDAMDGSHGAWAVSGDPLSATTVADKIQADTDAKLTDCPSGETREAVARLTRDLEAHPGNKSVCVFSDDLRLILALLRPAAPDGGGEHCPHCDRMLVMGCGCNFTAAIPASEGGEG